MTVLRCSVCGQLLPLPDPAVQASSHTDQDTLLSERPVCNACIEKLSSSTTGSTHRTTILRPLLNVGGSPIVEAAIDQPISSDPLAAITSPTPPLSIKGDSGSQHSDSLVTGSGGVSGARGESSVSGSFAPPGDAHSQRRRVNSYDIIEEISRGSFGVVYKARQQGLDRVVALKVLLAGQHASAEAVARFHREAKAVARLKHPNIVPIYDIGTHDGHHYFAMEFVEGHALSTLITEEKISISQALAIAESLADAFHSAHTAGVIHRDIKPSNILLDTQNQPHITDFGLAKQVDLDTKYTMSGTTLGTPAYMPPEQARGEIDRIDARSDVYAIGAVLYEMLTGKTPFAGRSLLEVVVAVISEPVRPPRQLNPKIHRDIQTIVLKCLEKDPRLRYASAADLRDDLRRFRSGEAIRAKPAGFVRLGARFVRRQSALIAAIFVVLFALGFSYLRVQKSKQEEIELKQARFNEQINKKPRWRPDWWFPLRDDAQLNDEQRDHVKLTGNKCQNTTGFIGSEVDGWDFVDGKTIHLPRKDAMSIREDCFGDVDADIHFKIPEAIAEAGVRVGIESVLKPYAGIPFLFEYRTNPSTVRIIGPKNLNARTTSGDPGMIELEVKAEKQAPELDEGKYTLNIHREGTKLSFQLMPDRGSRSVSIAIDDIDLSNWVFKDTRLVFRTPSLVPPIEIQSVDVRHRDVPEEELGFMKFREGEYQAAEKGLQDLATRDDHFKSAQAYLSLGLINQITHINSWWLEKPDMFQEALRELDTFRDQIKQRRQELTRDRAKYDHQEPGSADRFLQEVDNAEREAVSLATELHLRRILRLAKTRDWKGVQSELKVGWPDRTIGEPLAWNLDSVLVAAVHHSADEDPDLPLETALALFQKLGITAGSEHIGKVANELGLLLSFGGRFDDLVALHTAYPSAYMFQSFVDGIDRAVEKGKMVDATRLLKHIVAPARAAGQSRQLLAKVCAQIEKHSGMLAGRENFNAFTDSLLPVMVAYLPQDDEALGQIGNSIDKIARLLIKGGRFTDLVKLHNVLRAKSPTETRLASAFAEAVGVLAAANDPESQSTALDLLNHAGKFIAQDNPEIQQSAEALGRRRMTTASGDPNYQALIEVYHVYPSPGLVKMADEAMHDMLAARRYEDAINFYQRARGEFGNAGTALTPGVLAALENVSADKRDRFLAAISDSVTQTLKAANDDSDRAWALEYGDMLMALGQMDKAHEKYQGLSATADLNPELFGKVSVRLCALQIARTGTGYNALSGLISRDKTPDEVKLAAKLLSAPTLLNPAELGDKLKALPGPRLFSAAEWELLSGIRAFADQRTADAQANWNSAIQKASRDHSWVTGVASQLLRLAAHGPSDDPPPTEKPDPENGKTN